ncbi:MAG: DUF4440 domain-containing protein [Rhizobiaceae bacterium]|nr:DUF4440 domain-containing protein [Rhizobiaceae bacterium]
MPNDKQAIIKLIERETTAFLSRDFETWADCWVYDEGIRRLGALMGGVMDYVEGWASGHDVIKEVFEKFPKPNPTAAQSMRRTNFSIRISGEMAWASYDQYGLKSDDPAVTVGLSHQIRILEKTNGQWRISMAGHGDTTLEYFDFPVIRIDTACRIEWMNDVAKRELGDHPALTRSGAFLRGRYGADDKRLRKAVKRFSALTVIERRPSIRHPRGRMADPIILGGDSADGQHIVWVTARDGMLLVTFRDTDNERSRLEEAAELYELSPTQLRVAALMLSGQALPKIAKQLGISNSTAKTHLTRIFDKTGSRSQPSLVAKMLGTTAPN